MELLNKDVILHLCSYLDLETLINIAEVYPDMQSEIFRMLKRKVFAFKLEVFPLDVVFFYVTRPKKEDFCDENSKEMLRDLDQGISTELPKSVYRRIPYCEVQIACLIVTQVGSATIPQEVEEILGLMTTARLSLKYESLIEGRKVLQWVSFNPGTILNIRQRYDYDHIRLQPDYDQVVPETRDLQIPPSKLASIKHLSFGGDIAPNELATLLHSSIPILSLQCDYELKEYFAIVQEYMRNFLEGRSTQERCIIYACRELLQCVFESIAGDGEHIIVNGSRQVRLVYPQAVLYLLFEQKNQSW